ncbi:hypothetical protein Ancab_015362 [Ancistrocladus abbreviatus]
MKLEKESQVKPLAPGAAFQSNEEEAMSDRLGRKFSFVRFVNGQNKGLLLQKFCNIWVGSFKLRMDKATKKLVEGHPLQGNGKQSSSKAISAFRDNKSYKDALLVDVPPRPQTSERGERIERAHCRNTLSWSSNGEETSWLQNCFMGQVIVSTHSTQIQEWTQ